MGRAKTETDSRSIECSRSKSSLSQSSRLKTGARTPPCRAVCRRCGAYLYVPQFPLHVFPGGPLPFPSGPCQAPARPSPHEAIGRRNRPAAAEHRTIDMLGRIFRTPPIPPRKNFRPSGPCPPLPSIRDRRLDGWDRLHNALKSSAVDRRIRRFGSAPRSVAGGCLSFYPVILLGAPGAVPDRRFECNPGFQTGTHGSPRLLSTPRGARSRSILPEGPVRQGAARWDRASPRRVGAHSRGGTSLCVA